MDLPTIPDGCTVFVVSSDPVQTTRLINAIVELKSDIPHVVQFSNSVPYTPVRVLTEILSPQSTLFIERHTHPERDRRIIAVFDNCFPDDSWKTNHCMQTFFTAGRTLAITSLFGVSDLDRLPPARASGIDILFVGISDRTIYDRYVNYLCTYEEFCTAVAEGFVVVRLDVAEPRLYRYAV
jgi:hypothetical protein